MYFQSTQFINLMRWLKLCYSIKMNYLFLWIRILWKKYQIWNMISNCYGKTTPGIVILTNVHLIHDDFISAYLKDPVRFLLWLKKNEIILKSIPSTMPTLRTFDSVQKRFHCICSFELPQVYNQKVSSYILEGEEIY